MAEVFRQSVDHLHQLVVGNVGLSVVFDELIAGVDVVVVRSLVDDHIPAHLLAVVVDEDVPHDRDRPRL